MNLIVSVKIKKKKTFYFVVFGKLKQQLQNCIRTKRFNIIFKLEKIVPAIEHVLIIEYLISPNSHQIKCFL